MATKRIFWWSLAIYFWALVLPAQAYFLVVVQENGPGYASVGEEVKWLLFRGEPFQGIVRDLLPPKAFMVLPNGKSEPVALSIANIKDYATGKERRGYRPHYTPTQKGDYYLCLVSTPAFVQEIGEVWQEFTKIALHVNTETAWQRPVGLKAEIVPLSRPYGLESGALFRGCVLFQGKPVKDALIQATLYHGIFIPSEDLPSNPKGQIDFARMYPSVRTDANGLFALTLNQPGWWLISARLPQGYSTLGGQKFPFIIRASLWLYVFPPFVPQGTFPKIKTLPPRPLE